MRHEPRRKTPEELLKQCQAEEAAVAKRGSQNRPRLRRSGKSFRMFDEHPRDTDGIACTCIAEHFGAGHVSGSTLIRG